MVKKIITCITVICMLLTSSMLDAYAKVKPGTDFGYNRVVGSKEYAIAPGIVENDVVLNNHEGTVQNKAFVLEVDVKNPNAHVIAGYKDYSTSSWGLQTLTDQAAAAEAVIKKDPKYGSDAVVVGGENAGFFNMGNGEPEGAFVMNGKVIRDTDEWHAYLAILNDGTAELRDGTVPLGSNIREAIAGSYFIVKDGVSQIGEYHDPNDRVSRTAVGLKADGTLVLFANDGRQAPYSTGMTMYELAEAMIGMGCVSAINLDGGGSTTFATRREGTNKLSVVNSPSDGAQRGISTSLLVVSTAKPSGVFDHAVVTPNDELYTPNSNIQFNAKGVDSSGSNVELPSNVTWGLDEASKALGTIDANTGLFKSNGKLGKVTVQLKIGDVVYGSSTIEIVTPDEINFISDEVSLGFEETTDFGLSLKKNKREINFKDGDIIWNITDPKMGTFKGNEFTSSDGQSLNGTVTAISAYDSTVSSSIHVIVGMLPTVVWDFEDYVDPTTGETIPAKEYYTIGAQGDGSKYFTSNYGRGGNESAEIVSIDDDEPVRFGNHSLKLNYDFRNCGEVTEGANFGTSDSLTIPGSPSAVGVWVYAPEGTGVKWEGDGTQAGFWLRGYVKDGNGVNMPYDFTLEPKAVTGDQQPGIYWEGWKYLEADLTKLTGPFSIQPGMTFRLMYVAGTHMGTKTAGSIYFDNFQFVYGANVDDIDSPIIDSIKVNNQELTDGMEIKSNKVSFSGNFHDVLNKYTSGIDANTIRMYIDGVNVANNGDFNYAVDPDGSKAQLNDVTLLNGQHSFTVSLRDKFGNDVSKTIYFTIKGTEIDVPTVTVVSKETAAILGETINLEIKASDASNISKNTTSIKLSKQFPDYEVIPSENYDVTSSYSKITGLLTIDATRKAGATSADNVIATLRVKVPNELKQNDEFTYRVNTGSYEVNNVLYTYSTPEITLPVGATYTIKHDMIFTGTDAILTVLDSKGNAAPNVSIYKEDGVLVGTTDSKGVVTTNEFSVTAGDYKIYAQDANGKTSFVTTVSSYAANGETDGTPYSILNNAVKDNSSQKNISWMVHPNFESQQYIEYRIAGSTTWNKVKAESELVTFTKEGNTVSAVNNVILTGLSSNKKYEYRVGNDSKWSNVMTFNTGTKDRPTKFFVFGDVQAEDMTNIQALLENLGKKDYTFGIQTGDAVDDAISYSNWKEMLDLLDVNALKDTDLIHVLGNHEYSGDGNGSKASAIYNLPVNKAGGYYSVTYGNVYVATINYTGTGTQLQEALDWLKQDVKSSNAKWKILTMHQPAYYTNVAGGNSQINTMVPPVVDELGIDFVFSGHDHSYARTEPIKNRVVDKNGTVYFISGSSGEKSYTITNNPDFHFAQATQDFNAIYLDVEANHNDITVTAYDVQPDGTANILDQFTKSKDACYNDEHNYLYDATYDELICKDCSYTVGANDSLYGGFANEINSGRLMCFASGKALTGHQYINSLHYYFDENGLGLEGEYTFAGEKVIFSQAQFTKCTTAEVLVAGLTGPTSNFVLYSDGRLVIDGSGKMYNHKSRGTVPWVDYVTKVSKVVIGSEITEIGAYSFSFLESCREVVFEDNSKLTKINDLGFYFMSNLREINIPEGVSSIENYAFGYDKGLRKVFVPNSVTFIKDTVFKYCNLDKLVLEVGKGSYAESYAKANGINYVYHGSTTPGNSGECGETARWEVTADGTLKITGSGKLSAFYNTGYQSVPWYNLRHTIKKVEVGKYITELSTFSLRGLDNCTAVIFEDGSKLNKIGSESFRYMKNLKELKLPEGLVSVSNLAFADSGLESVYIPNSVKSIHSEAFHNVDKTKLVLKVGKGSYAESYAKANGIKYVYHDGTKPETGNSGVCGDKAKWEVTADGTLKITGSGKLTAFYNTGYKSVPWYNLRHTIKKVEIGKDITEISTYSFRELDNCTSVVFAEGSQLVKVGSESFRYMKNLKELRLPEKLASVSNVAFADSGLESVYIPNSVKSIHSAAFHNVDKTKLVLKVGKGSYAESYAKANGIKYVYHDGTKPETGNSGVCGDKAKWEVTADGTLKITGSGKLTAFYNTGYKSVPWYNLRHTIKKVEIGKDITEISTYSFRELDNCTSVVFAEGSQLVKVGSESFRYMKNLKELRLPEKLASVSNVAFADSGLESVYIPNSVKSIHSAAFHNVDKTKLVLKVGKGSYAESYAKTNGIKYVYHDGTKPETGNSGVCGDKAKWEVTADGTLKITGSGKLFAFYETGRQSVPWYNLRHKIKKVEIGKDITEITTYSFRGFDYCTSVVFEEGSQLVKVGSESFRYMISLKELKLPEKLTSVSNVAFADSGLESVYIPNSVKSIHKDAFLNVNKDKLVLKVGKGSYAESYAKTNGIKYVYHDGTKPETGNSGVCGDKAKWEVTADGTLKITGSGKLFAFYETGRQSVPWYNLRHKIKKVEIGKDITEITTYSFRGFDYCTSVVFEEGSQLVKVGSESFRYMISLKELKLPEKLTSVSNVAFADSGLESVYIPNSVKSIHKDAFLNVNKDKLVLKVGKGSYAESYAKSKGLSYVYY